MKKFTSLLLALVFILTLCSCNEDNETTDTPAEEKTYNTSIVSDELLLDFKDTSFLVSEIDGTLFVINPDKTVSVVGTNNGNCAVNNWENIEKIFATNTATYGIQSDGTCLIAQNHTSTTKPEFNGAKEITEDFALFEDGTIMHKTANITDTLPKCTDIFQKGNNIYIVTENNKVEFHHFEVSEDGICDINTSGFYSTTHDVNNYLSNWSNVKQINYCWFYKQGDRDYYLTAVRNDGKVYACNLSEYGRSPSTIDDTDYFANIDSCVPVGDDVFIAVTKEGIVTATGKEFSELGGETPKLLTIDNAISVYNFTGTHGGKNFNYAIVISKNGSVFAYKINGSFPSNIAEAFSKYKSFEIV